MEHEELMRQFLEAYEAKDLATLTTYLAPDVVLRDWNLEVTGKEAALKEFAKNFEQAASLSIEIRHIYTSGTGAAAEVEIIVNGVESLRVVDVLSLNEAGQVTAIVSYKGL
jgi:ketosteroid isomerase-like protein